MVLSIIIIIWLLLACVSGWRQGLAITIISMIGNVILWVFAIANYQRVAMALGGADVGFGTKALAFIVIIVAGRFLIHLLAKWSRHITWIPVIKQANSLGGAIVAVIFHYIAIFIVLSLLLLVQNTWVTSQYAESGAAQFIVTNSPLLNSNQFQNWLGTSDNQTNTSNTTHTDSTNTSDSSSSSY
ncbi:CvpA family protein [Lacticaseibacillus thailandensis]|uniref:CvpA family protein n=1 Tax=Lacticaseibacillus thailandensis DSM 22698 = JCM 13996 TaxID=1423810 RepID=A0A0R2C629_9LACO|nr:CvpA family protein [Lacticaseibacillus thailandensis]KRM87080.1 hypothetical protein FD19_GL001231 [Lacticaseibacillus thailandensis DSM 22698 = JCM 13996]